MIVNQIIYQWAFEKCSTKSNLGFFVIYEMINDILVIVISDFLYSKLHNIFVRLNIT